MVIAGVKSGNILEEISEYCCSIFVISFYEHRKTDVISMVISMHVVRPVYLVILHMVMVIGVLTFSEHDMSDLLPTSHAFNWHRPVLERSVMD